MDATKPRLSCLACTKKKRKCDKNVPCNACTSNGIVCTGVQRMRLPRGRSARVSKQQAALATRVDRIESLMKKVTAASNLNTSYNLTEPRADVSIDDNRNGVVEPALWALLSSEVAGIREAIKDPEDDDNDTTPPLSLNDETHSLPILFPYPAYVSDVVPLQPPSYMKEKLYSLYRDRVDNVCKTLHWPTALAQLSANRARTPQRESDRSLNALDAAIMYMAVCSTTPPECEAWFFESKAALVSQARASAEAQLARSRLLQTPDIVTLQAFVIYLQAHRSCQNYASSWTLLAIAVRVASTLGLGSENAENYDVTDLEIRRRLWYTICLLDTQGVLDRGSAPLIALSEMGLAPKDTNDANVSCSQLPIVATGELTEMSFALMTHEAMICQRKLCELSSGGPHDDWAGWKTKMVILAEFKQHYNEKYITVDPATTTPLRNFMVAGARTISNTMTLITRRPPYRQQSNCAPPGDDFDSLEASTRILESHLEIDTAQNSPWSWKSWVPWYAIAAVLAELCRRPQDPMAERSLRAACEVFQQHATPASDPESGILWRPIAKLLKRVQRLRRNDAAGTPSTGQGSSSMSPDNTNEPCVAGHIRLGACDDEIIAPTRNDPGAHDETPFDALDMSIFDDLMGSSNLPYNLPGTDIGESWLDWDLLMQQELDYPFAQP